MILHGSIYAIVRGLNFVRNKTKIKTVRNSKLLPCWYIFRWNVWEDCIFSRRQFIYHIRRKKNKSQQDSTVYKCILLLIYSLCLISIERHKCQCSTSLSQTSELKSLGKQFWEDFFNRIFDVLIGSPEWSLAKVGSVGHNNGSPICVSKISTVKNTTMIFI